MEGAWGWGCIQNKNKRQYKRKQKKLYPLLLQFRNQDGKVLYKFNSENPRVALGLAPVPGSPPNTPEDVTNASHQKMSLYLSPFN